ncbi:hypothetical protein [Lewinella sp. W8]|uniref:hypothetical protein n=1 Tax=Lewinella sp. W8 TaxID=2528208 RepID=UPI001068CA62|nr:hypothetical protein [Lewinella sp. W8]MTB52387.1 hypothetical protein [Lewinella sp. W8]
MKKRYQWINHLLNFIAVILGVYLAFFINDRAQASAERKERDLLVASMITELASDVETFEDYHIPVNREQVAGLDSILTFLTEGNIESLNRKLGIVIQVENFSPNTSVYDSMKSSGKVKLFANPALQKALSDFYDGTVLECKSKNQVQGDFFLGEVIKWLIANADLTEMVVLNEGELVPLKNTLVIYQSLIREKVAHYELIVEESRALMGALQTIGR